MNKSYTISDFYLYIKLGIWKSGEVLDLGNVYSVCKLKVSDIYSNASTTDYLTNLETFPFLRKDISYYQEQNFAKKNLAIGIDLLDFYLLYKKKAKQSTLYSYIVVISTNRLGLNNKEYTYILKVSTYLDEPNFRELMYGELKTRKKNSYFRKRSSSGVPNFKAIHSTRL